LTRRHWRCPRPASPARGALAVASTPADVIVTRIPARRATARAPPGRVSPCLLVHNGVLKTGMIYVGYISKHLTNT
jgi:hypothetical protein